MLSGVILRDPASSGRTDTTATAANIVAEFSSAAVGSCIKLVIVNGETNSGNFSNTITISAGTGVTLSGLSPVAANGATTFLLICTNVGTGTEAVRMIPV